MALESNNGFGIYYLWKACYFVYLLKADIFKDIEDTLSSYQPTEPTNFFPKFSRNESISILAVILYCLIYLFIVIWWSTMNYA